MDEEKLMEEFRFCLQLWESQGYCNFGGKTHCEACGTPYLLYKLMTGNVLHDEHMNPLTADDWKSLIKEASKKAE